MIRFLTHIKRPLKIVLFYFIFGSLWILFSDSLLGALVSDASLLMFISTLKGWIYVIVTALLLFRLTYKEFSQIEALHFKLSENYNELEVYRDALELKVEERSSELIASNQELIAINTELFSTLERLQKTQNQLIQSEKVAALSSIVTDIAREISHPIGIAVTSVSYMEKELADIANKLNEGSLKKSDFEEFISEATIFIQTTARNLERSDLLIKSFHQISVDQISQEKRQFNVKHYLDELLISISPLLENNQHRVIVTCSEELVINSYPGLLTQILTNFITNSLWHGFDANFSGTIKIHFEQSENMNIMTYEDNGKGVPKDILDRIYEPFFTTTHGDLGRTGLGLYFVHNVVTQNLEGEIKCSSESGKGLSFVIRFPDFKDD